MRASGPRSLRHAVLWTAFASLALLAGCGNPAPSRPGPEAAVRRFDVSRADDPANRVARVRPALQSLEPFDLLLVGERHDAPEHQALEATIVQVLAQEQRLAALALEMAERGRSTAGLPRDADDDALRLALAWNDAGWPWPLYAPAIRAAVRAGVPVVGANLPDASIGITSKNRALDEHLTPANRQKQIQKIREGHCDLLPERAWLPMLRVQTARDAAMAQTLRAAAAPGRVVVLLAGSAHVDRRLGVPGHLDGAERVRSIALYAPSEPGDAPPELDVDAVWITPPRAEADPCAALRERWGQQGHQS